ncbi:Transcriptional regulatory protein TdiR [Stieleria maiorica]|uniref:Transcriptional regulatory protein TdiR n=1 Tax=Stieleria maiorica TaxID=2795974 RepID=A0A5B9MLZ4_9BACT|nr:response regulator [Stieleria maiorica]QEG00997.1 Transcriptional regulatory protein TdiR [Stieleria maiorica]
MTDRSTVFVVDDNSSALNSVCALLTAFDLPVEPFDSAEAFLAGYDASQRGCLLLDVQLQGIGGLELLRQLRANDCDLPVIVISGNADKQVVKVATELGASQVLHKPVPPNELVDVVKQTLH